MYSVGDNEERGEPINDDGHNEVDEDELLYEGATLTIKDSLLSMVTF